MDWQSAGMAICTNGRLKNIPQFWEAVWDFVGIRASRRFDKVVDDPGKFPGATWFPGARLNFAENLLRFRDDNPAFVFRREDGKRAQMSYRELCESVARLAAALRRHGIVPGDRIAAYMPNTIETAVTMLAATSIGAVWASCGTELGTTAVVDRLGQIGPKILFTVDGQIYKGKTVDVLERVRRLAQDLPSLEKVVVVPYIAERPETGGIKNAVLPDEFTSGDTVPDLEFEQLPFDHPVYNHVFVGDDGQAEMHGSGPGGPDQSPERTYHTYRPSAR